MRHTHMLVKHNYAPGALDSYLETGYAHAMSKKPHYIREWRRHRGLSQEQLALRIDKDQSYLSKIERFKHDYSQGLLEAVAEALACEPADLIMRDPTQAAAIWDIWDNIPIQERPRVIKIIETFADKKSA